MSVTIVETPFQSMISAGKKVTVKPYVDNTVDNMGLQQYDQVIFEGVWHEEQLACIEFNGVKRYVTGLDEFAPSIKKITDPEKRNAKIRDIRATVSQLEKDLASNVVDPDDEQFWNKVKLLRPDNDEFWSKISIKCGNTPVYLNPNSPHDLIKIRAIEEGGFSIVARNYEDARKSGGKIKFYLDRFEDTVSTLTEGKKIKNNAISKLQELFDTNYPKLFYIAKVVDANSALYKNSTPKDIVYDNMDKFITGNSYERSAVKASKMFIEAYNSSMEDIKIRAIVKDMMYYKIAYAKSDGFIHHKATGEVLGRNPSDCAEFLKNPMNEDITNNILEKVTEYWNK